MFHRALPAMLHWFSSYCCHLYRPMSVFQFLYLVSLSSQALKSKWHPADQSPDIWQIWWAVRWGGPGPGSRPHHHTVARANTVGPVRQPGTVGDSRGEESSGGLEGRGEESSSILPGRHDKDWSEEVAVLEPVNLLCGGASRHSDSQPSSSFILPSSQGWPGLPLLSLPEKWTMPGWARQPRIGCLFSQSEILLWKISNWNWFWRGAFYWLSSLHPSAKVKCPGVETFPKINNNHSLTEIFSDNSIGRTVTGAWVASTIIRIVDLC